MLLSTSAIDNERKALETDLAYKQRLDLLLRILEKREAARFDRLGPERGLGFLLDDIQCVYILTPIAT